MIALLYKGYLYYRGSLDNQMAIIMLNISTNIYLVFPFIQQLCSKRRGGGHKNEKEQVLFPKNLTIYWSWKGEWRCINKYDTEQNEAITVYIEMCVCVCIYTCVQITVPHPQHVLQV